MVVLIILFFIRDCAYSAVSLPMVDGSHAHAYDAQNFILVPSGDNHQLKIASHDARVVIYGRLGTRRRGIRLRLKLQRRASTYAAQHTARGRLQSGHLIKRAKANASVVNQ